MIKFSSRSYAEYRKGRMHREVDDSLLEEGVLARYQPLPVETLPNMVSEADDGADQ